MRLFKRTSYAGLAALLISAAAAAAQDKSLLTDRAYTPSLADVMAVTQLRHFKLWYSVKLKNWDLANYELGQMIASFKTATRLYPGNPAADMTGMENPAALVGEAIKAKDSAKFDAAFNQMITACNNCHTAADRAYIFIRVPTRSPFSNQMFEPQRK
jgi:hypothetical protein